ncbi:histidine--tRNA ligase [Candidatus Acetothermia bacterium]|nr:histidine--tRNA ligase [Candidatus Acetothermia bacterium]MBI3643212.1 histidine--tRNA ligase [Candidatus Acetothermia bacterium]
MELQLPRGMRDFPPEEKILRDRVITLLKETFERYGFSPLETPVVERWEVLASKYAGGDEILKESFKLKDQGDRDLGLRYDLTTPLARFIGMNPMIKRPFKRYHIGTVYRDGPIKQGRYREFYQCDVDTVGVHSALSDAEFILISLDVFEKLGFKIEVRVNNRVLLRELAEAAQVPSELINSGILSIDKLEKIGAKGVREEMLAKGLSPQAADLWLSYLDVSGSNSEVLQAVQKIVPQSVGAKEMAALLNLLSNTESVRFAPSLARGLGYYTGTIFEVFSLDPPFGSAVAGGGRYDNLIADFIGSKDPFPAIGISFGLEPILELLKEREGFKKKTVAQVYVIPIGVTKEGLLIAQELRRAGIKVDLDLAGKGMRANFEYANAYEIPYVVIIGKKELEQGKVTLRDMKTGEEQQLKLGEVIEKFI